jgi:ribosomal protein S18 acetylase RimI-like enzyme
MSANWQAALVIRQFCYPEDYPAVRALWDGAGRGINVRRSDEPHELEKKLERDPDLFLVAEENGLIVGSVIGGFDGRRGMLYHLAVAPAYRQRGLGQALMDEVEQRLRQKGCIRCYLMVTKDNPEAMTYYEKRGWERMDFVETYAKDLG